MKKHIFLSLLGLLSVIIIFLIMIFGRTAVAPTIENGNSHNRNVTTLTSPTMGAEVGDRALPFTIAGIDGSVYELDSLTGKVVVIHTVTADCDYCIEEVREMVPIWEEHGHEGEIFFMTIDMHPEGTEESLLQYREDYGTRWAMSTVNPAASMLHDYHISKPASTIVIDKNGMVVHRDESVTRQYELRELITSYR